MESKKVKENDRTMVQYENNYLVVFMPWLLMIADTF
jgi:hypothetical protein